MLTCRSMDDESVLMWVRGAIPPRRHPWPTSMRFFFGRSKRQAASAKGVKSPAATKDESTITPLGWQNLIEVSGNLLRLRGENVAQGVESIRHAILGPYRASFGNAGVREPLFTL
jgi:hypothetical protein